MIRAAATPDADDYDSLGMTEDAPAKVTRIFFDGDCGMCHQSVALFARRATSLESFRFAPLQGETCRRVLSEQQRRHLSDSVAVLTAEGDLLTEAAATVYLMRRMTGGYRLMGGVLRWVPTPLLNGPYRLVARLRQPISRRMNQACAMPSDAVRERLDP